MTRQDSYVLSDDVEKLANSSLPDQFQCFVDVIGDVSIKNGLGELWSKSQPLLQLHLDNWQRCKNIENKFLNLLYAMSFINLINICLIIISIFFH